jgi:uncharacterized RDD family membrane protein YckC
MVTARTRRARWLMVAVGGCLAVVALLILMAWAEVTFTPADECASTNCTDIWLFPVLIGPWFVIAAIVLGIVAIATGRRPAAAAESMAPPASTNGTARPLGSAGLRILGGLIDLLVMVVITFLISSIFKPISAALADGGMTAVATSWNLIGLVVGLLTPLVYLGVLWHRQGQSIGMMPFGLKVRNELDGGYPSLSAAHLRAFVWLVEVFATSLLIGAIGWLWQLWDVKRQAIHDKVAGTIVTAG